MGVAEVENTLGKGELTVVVVLGFSSRWLARVPAIFRYQLTPSTPLFPHLFFPLSEGGRRQGIVLFRVTPVCYPD